ncbi:hypothetical protein HK099_001612, partial [Clydaea vesicula]
MTELNETGQRRKSVFEEITQQWNSAWYSFIQAPSAKSHAKLFITNPDKIDLSKEPIDEDENVLLYSSSSQKEVLHSAEKKFAPSFPQMGLDLGLEEVDFSNFDYNSGSKKFLNEYTLEDLQTIFDATKAQDDLKLLGFHDLSFKMDVKDHFVHRIVLTDSSLFKNKKDFLKWKPEKLKDNEFLIDLFARRKNYNCFDLVGYQSAVTDLTNSIETEKVDIDEKKENLIPNFTDATTKNGNPKESVLPRRSFHVSKVDAKRIINFLEKFIGKNEGFKVSVWEWMCMQNPTKSFDSLPAFPGQRYP